MIETLRIDDESYFSIPGTVVGKERSNAAHYEVHKPEPKEEIERCLKCPFRDCTRSCKYSPDYKGEKAKPTEKERKRAKNVARLYLDGMNETGIAFKLGLTKQEVADAIKLARKEKLLD